MAAANGRPWTREETVAVLSLYCQIPFGKMHARNPDVKRIADHLDRTPSSVAFRLVNLASLDPEHQQRGVTGMKNASELDRQVWADFYGNWEALAQSAAASIMFDHTEEVVQETEVLATVRVRRGQSFFRRTVCAAYDDRCCITGISSRALLRASHIIPWSHDAAYRLDPRNGLALNALHDSAFDRGLITLDEDFRVLLSKHLADNMPRSVYKCFFENYAGKSIAMPSRFLPCDVHLTYHRTHVFMN